MNDVLEQTVEAESPRSFIYWAALSAISAVVKKNVYLDKYIYKLYPNTFVMLVAKSGSRKGFPVTLATKLVEKVGNTRVIAGRNSIQAVIQTLASSYTKEGSKDADKGIQKDAAGFLVSGEFGNFIIQDPATTTILTDLYDTHANDIWRNSLKVGGVETLKDVCLTLLAASNDTLLKEALPASAYQGGFIGRTMIIQENSKARKNPLTEAPKVRLDIDYLAKYLKELSKLSGPFIWSPEGKKLYEDWYNEFSPENLEDTTGTADRLHDQVLKVAMLISLSERTDLFLEESDIEQALKHCLHFSKGLDRLSLSGGKSEGAVQTGLVMKVLIEREGVPLSRPALLRKLYPNVQAVELDKIIDTLDQSGAIVIERNSSNEVTYNISKLVLDRFKQIKKGVK